MRLWGLAWLVVAACGDSLMPASLVATAPEPPGAHCPYGGTAIETGRDLNDNGTLDASEVTSTSYVCQQLAHSLVRVVPEPPGANCANGGQAIEVGVDACVDDLRLSRLRDGSSVPDLRRAGARHAVQRHARHDQR